MRDPGSQPGFSAASRISIGLRRYMCHSMPEFHAGARGLARDPSFHAGYNVRSCFFVRSQGFRADFTAGSGTRSPNRDSMRDHVPRSGFGCTFGIQCGIRELARFFHEFHACWTSLPPPRTVLKALYRHCSHLALR